ncbi:hypothetical protein L486_03857 [Kwoniella mangroviensis CBS 10435]|uniref:D-glycerate 3-kinase n=1 Tax=Kwoniella mangroviensis CBS 10435 TaxID=1331196 RepID=A0A1B9IV13_9TREE|nr:hypothetical protein L486_03857 [Kwoniella mangroviensis CBS 10435]
MSTSEAIDTRLTSHKAQLIAEFIAKHRGHVKGRGRPLIVSMQGPQGAGKSTLAAALVKLLASSYKLTTAVASLDDFYLDREGLDALAATYSSNKMLQGRGPPGTHDIDLLKRILEQVRQPRSNSSNSVALPVFDKSLFNGRGDRSKSTIPINPVHLDVFMLEGWSLGFHSLPEDRLRELWKVGKTASKHEWKSILQVNDNLSQLNTETDSYFDCHISITPLDWDYVYQWRLQQEHHMKRDNGGSGMSDEEVRLFVDRYMPYYELYGKRNSVVQSLRLVYGSEREVVNVEEDSGSIGACICMSDSAALLRGLVIRN